MTDSEQRNKLIKCIEQMDDSDLQKIKIFLAGLDAGKRIKPKQNTAQEECKVAIEKR